MAREVYERLGRAGRWAFALGVAAVLFLAWLLWPLFWALVLPSTGAASAQADEEQRLAELDQKFNEQIAQFDGRTVFYVPAPPSAEAPIEEEPADPGLPPPPPDRYGGPGIIAMVNESVWFSDGTRVRIGESSGDLTVVALNAPWDATILWKQREFTVPFFDRDSVVLAKSSAGSGIDPPPSDQAPPSDTNGATPSGDTEPAPSTAPATPPPAEPEPSPPPPPDEPPPGYDGPPPPPPPDDPRDGGGQDPTSSPGYSIRHADNQHTPRDSNVNEGAR